MSSPKKEEVPDLQRSFVFGNSVIKPQTPHIPPEDAQEVPGHYLTEILCLRRTQLKYVGESILKISTLKYLNLEGNQISSVPDSLFIRLPNLLWFDLRNNQITLLPVEIGSHRSLKTLLLEGNPIQELPPELGNVITLNGLNLRYCPITFPPQDVVAQGLQSILQYLRSVMAKRPVSMRKTPPELPVVEKLQLSELTGSNVEEQDESVDEDELQRFRELKDKMILLDRAELGSIAQGSTKPKSHPISLTRRQKAATEAGIIPKLPLFAAQQCKKPEATVKGLREKRALEHRRKNNEALQEWRTQAKMTQEEKISEGKQTEHEKKLEAADADSKPGVEDSSHAPQKPGMSSRQYKEHRSIRMLEQEIHAHTERMEERHRDPRGSNTEQMAIAEHDLKMLRKLQARLLERKRNLGRDLENYFT